MSTEPQSVDDPTHRRIDAPEPEKYDGAGANHSSRILGWLFYKIDLMRGEKFRGGDMPNQGEAPLTAKTPISVTIWYDYI